MVFEVILSEEVTIVLCSEMGRHPALNADPATGYPAGQAFARSLRGEGCRGLIYPSVRHQGGRCFVAFDPGIVQNVRPGASWVLTWSGTPEYALKAL